MSEIRTYVKTTGTKGLTPEPKLLADGRVRVDWRNGKTLIASELMSEAEARGRGLLLTSVLPVDPPPPPPPPPVDPPPATGLPPYPTVAADSPWNLTTPNGGKHPNSDTWMAALIQRSGTQGLTCDPDQYAGPTYRGTAAQAPVQRVTFNGVYSEYANGDGRARTYSSYTSGYADIPILPGLVASEGSDAHIIQIIDRGSLGVWEYGFWQAEQAVDGSWSATNGYGYPLAKSHGAFRDGRGGRGSGNPYGAGLVRREDLAAGAILHKLAMPSAACAPTAFVWPACKTDGATAGPPEGAIMVLDPTFDVNTLSVTANGSIDNDATKLLRMIARALQHPAGGAVVCDNSGSTKIYLEERTTAGWDSTVTRSLTSKIPLSRCWFVQGPAMPAAL